MFKGSQTRATSDKFRNAGALPCWNRTGQNLFDCPKLLVLPTTLSPDVWLVIMCNEWLLRTWEDLPRETCDGRLILFLRQRWGCPVFGLCCGYIASCRACKRAFEVRYCSKWCIAGAEKFDKVRRPALPHRCAGRDGRKGRCCGEAVAPDDKEGKASQRVTNKSLYSLVWPLWISHQLATIPKDSFAACLEF